MDRTACIDALALRGIPGLGDRGFRKLVDAFGSAGAALAAEPRALRERCAASDALLGALAEADREGPRRQWQALRDAGFAMLVYGGPGYPERLAAIADPPAVLYQAGAPLDRLAPAVAVVGSRRASSHGARFARRLAAGLAEAGVAVVSGLARGIDAAAHQGALDAGGATLAVFGSGLDVVYPPRHAELAAAILERGGWCSEQPLGAEPRPHHFPRRNRIISGLAAGVVVVEASERSGSLITARCALEQGREVFAVPGLPGAYTAQGTHGLLREGAKLVESVADVLQELAPGATMHPQESAPAPPPPHLAALWQALEDAPLHIDEVAAKAGLPAAQAAAGLLELTLDGFAVEWPGRRYARSRGC